MAIWPIEVFAIGKVQQLAYRKLDPRTKAAAIKAMGKAVDQGTSVNAAARALSEKYGIGATTLQKYFTDANEAADPDSETTGETTKQPTRTRRHNQTATTDAETAADEETGTRSGDSRVDGVAVLTNSSPVDHNNAGAEMSLSADALSKQFTDSLQTISADFVTRLQAAALDELIGKMRSLRDQFQHH